MTAARSSSLYQAALLRASRLAAEASTIPTWPRATSATSSGKPGRWPSWPDWPRSAAITGIGWGRQPNAWARSTKAY